MHCKGGWEQDRDEDQDDRAFCILGWSLLRFFWLHFRKQTITLDMAAEKSFVYDMEAEKSFVGFMPIYFQILTFFKTKSYNINVLNCYQYTNKEHSFKILDILSAGTQLVCLIYKINRSMMVSCKNTLDNFSLSCHIWQISIAWIIRFKM